MSTYHRDEENSLERAFNSNLAFEGLMEQARKISNGDTLDVSLARFQKEKNDYHDAGGRYMLDQEALARYIEQASLNESQNR